MNQTRFVSEDFLSEKSLTMQNASDCRRLLKKYGYPPDLQKMAVDKIVQQAELMAGSL